MSAAFPEEEVWSQMKAALLKLSLTAVIIGTMCGCQEDIKIKLSVQQQTELNESLSRAGLHAKYSAAGLTGITLDDPVQSELSSESLGQIVDVVRKFRDKNHITSVSSLGIQGPNSYVSIDNLGP
jgi:hypothetical protein